MHKETKLYEVLMVAKEEGNKCQSNAIVNFLNLWHLKKNSKPNGKSKKEQSSLSN
jgi:hypothetical protein